VSAVVLDALTFAIALVSLGAVIWLQYFLLPRLGVFT
jgi:hypothetical protein